MAIFAKTFSEQGSSTLFTTGESDSMERTLSNEQFVMVVELML